MDFSIMGAFERLARRWWLVALAGILGACLGWLFSLQLVPVYEARAIMLISVDYAQTGNLDDLNLDHAVGVAGSTVNSGIVFERLIAAAQARQIALDASDILQNFSMERRQQQWDLVVRHADPQAAAFLANAWLEYGVQVLEEYRQHALRAQGLRDYLRLMSACPPAPDLDPPPPAICSGGNTIDTAHMQVIQADLSAEIQASRGVFSALVFAPELKAEAPLEPVLYQAQWLVFSGLILGLLVGIGVSSIGMFRKQ